MSTSKSKKEVQSKKRGMDVQDKKWYTTGDAAKACGVSIKTIERWCSRGLVSHHKTISNLTKISKEEFMRILPKLQEIKKAEESHDNVDIQEKEDGGNMAIKEKKAPKDELDDEKDTETETQAKPQAQKKQKQETPKERDEIDDMIED